MSFSVTIILWPAANRIGFENATSSSVSSFGVERKLQFVFRLPVRPLHQRAVRVRLLRWLQRLVLWGPHLQERLPPGQREFSHFGSGKWPSIAYEDQTLHGYLLSVGKPCTTLWLKGETWYKARPHNQPLPLKLLIHSSNEIISVHSPN